MADRMRIAIDADDAAEDLKTVLFKHLIENGYDITDLQYSKGKAMYPEIAYNLAKKIQAGEYERGILLCGTGLGMSIVANKVEGVYAGLCHDVYSAERLAKSNDANVLTMGARVIGLEHAKKIVDAWLCSDFDGGRSTPKVQQIRDLEKKSFSGA
jgi:ribose 5-phosphate isomerase B